MERALSRLSIRGKLLGIVIATAGGALVVAGFVFVAYDAATFGRLRLNDLVTQAEILGALSTAPLTFDDPAAATEYLAALRMRPSVAEAITYDAAGRVFATYRRAGLEPRDPPAPETQGHRTEGDDLVVFRRIGDGEDTLGTLYLRASLGRRERLLRFTGLVLAVSLGAMVVALLLLSRLETVVSRPILELTRAARGVVERQDYSQRVVKTSQDEIGVLVDAFNQMLAGIEEREASLHAANEALRAEVAGHVAARAEVDALTQALERRVAERTAELEAANRELEAFSYSVSHDLRAPLRSIDGFTAILERSHADRLDEQGRGYMARVRAAAQRMGHLIDDLLKLSRTVRSEMVRSRIDLSEMAAAIVRDLRASAPERSVVVTIAPGLVVDADPTLMRSVLENLLGNAWKFTSHVPEAHVEVGSKTVDGETAYFVKDDGAGFDMKYAGKLFGAFQRLHLESEYQGTGVGLANVQRIVRRHGGRVWAEAEVGRGATFYFTIG